MKVPRIQIVDPSKMGNYAETPGQPGAPEVVVGGGSPCLACAACPRLELGCPRVKLPPKQAPRRTAAALLTEETSQAVVPQPSLGQDALQSPALLGNSLL